MDQDQANTLLIFQVGPYSFCVSALEVESIISLPPITTIPFAPKSVAGTCLFHEKVAMVISLHQKFGLKRNLNNDNDQLIVTQLQSGLFAFWVDAVHDVTTSTDLQWEEISATHSNSVFDRFLLKDGQVILHTNFETLYNLPDAAYVDDALKALAFVGGKTEIEGQESSIDTGLTTTVKDGQISDDSEKNNQADSSLQSSSLDIFDFETISPSQGDLTSPPPGSIDYSIDEHDAFDKRHIRKIEGEKLATSRDQKKFFTKPGIKTGALPGKRIRASDKPATHGRFFEKKTAATYQARSNAFSSRRNSMAGWFFLLALLLAFAGAFFLWPSPPAKKKAAYHKETYQVVAEKQQPEKDFFQDAKKDTPPIDAEKEYVIISPTQAEEDETIEYETPAQTPSTPYTTSTGEAKTIVPPPDEPESDFVETEAVLEEPAKQQETAKETLVEATIFAESEVVGPEEETVPEERPETFEDQKGKGEIYRVENKDFALIVERPAKKELVVIDEVSKKKKIIQEYIHTVVKGDTLWDIAAKYLGNPFLYNKLADNSEIKNPNLIYPGDRVRIIKKRQNP